MESSAKLILFIAAIFLTLSVIARFIIFGKLKARWGLRQVFDGASSFVAGDFLFLRLYAARSSLKGGERVLAEFYFFVTLLGIISICAFLFFEFVAS